MNLREAALKFEESATKNVSDLEVFDTQNELKTFKGTNADGEDFSYQYIEDDSGVKYRVPRSVLAQIKTHLEEDPELLLFKVKKSGEGLKTVYTVIPVTAGKGKVKKTYPGVGKP